MQERPRQNVASCRTLPSALYWRGIPSKIRRRISVHENIYTYVSLTSVRFANWPQVCSPHCSTITSLDFDNASEGRFLLCGSRDCTISVYDLSSLGSDYYLNLNSKSNSSSNLNCTSNSMLENSRQRYHPVARSRRISTGLGIHDPNRLSIPTGHSHTVTQVKWYPIDSGLFLSSDACGNVLVWDTNAFTPVTSLSISPHDSLSASSAGMSSVSCMDLPNPRNNPSHMLLAVGSTRTSFNKQPGLSLVDDRVIRLCDIKSGSVSHQLVGHGTGRDGLGGVNVVQWSPTREFQLVSGGNDGCIKIFDVRKSGSRACLVTLDWQRKCPKFGQRTEEEVSTNVLPVKRRLITDDSTTVSLAPSNYSMAECSSRIQSHGGPIAALSHSPDGNYLVSASSSDQKINLWDIDPRSYNGVLLPTMYLGPSDSSPHPIEKKQRKVAFHVTQTGSERTAKLWVGSGSLLLGYRLHGMGGRPDKLLSGHLGNITSIAMQDNYSRLYTGCKDGMILSWGWKSNLANDKKSDSRTKVL